MRDGEQVASYVRSSSDKQSESHQLDDIDQWATNHEIDPQEIKRYADLAKSGADPGRKQFEQLIEDMAAGEIDRVIIWEISRLARLGSIYQRFFETAGDAGVIVNITNGWTDTVRPDGTGKLIADISAAVAEEERRKLIKRVESGIRRAKREGKWLGEVPVGFERNEEGYLRPNLDPSNETEDGFLEIRSALERIENGESYRKVAQGLNTTRQTLSRIDQDVDRKDWYLEADAQDERVEEALQEVQY